MAIRSIGALLIFFGTWEAAARLDDAWTEGAPVFGTYDQSVLTMTDEFGIRGRPNAHYSKWKMNSLGYRGPEVRWDRERVLTIGASETFGLYEPEGLEYPRQLESELNKMAGGDRYQVVNAGLPGQSLSSFARRAASVLREVRPAVAVVYPSLAIYIDPPPESRAPSLPPRASSLRPRILAKLTQLAEAQIPPHIKATAIRAILRVESPESKTLSALPKANAARFQRDLSRLLDRIEEAHVEPVLVTHATRFGNEVTADDADLLTEWRALHPMLRESGFLDMERRLNDVIRAEAARRGVRLVDAAQWMRGPDRFVEFVHFTPQGAHALAVAIAKGIIVSKGDSVAATAAP